MLCGGNSTIASKPIFETGRVAKTLHGAEMQPADAAFLCRLPPDAQHAGAIRNDVWTIDEQDRRAVHTHVARIAQHRREISMNRTGSSGRCFCSIRMSSSEPSQRRDQFSFAQQMQKGKSMSRSASIRSSGRSSRR